MSQCAAGCWFWRAASWRASECCSPELFWLAKLIMRVPEAWCEVTPPCTLHGPIHAQVKNVHFIGCVGWTTSLKRLGAILISGGPEHDTPPLEVTSCLLSASLAVAPPPLAPQQNMMIEPNCSGVKMIHYLGFSYSDLPRWFSRCAT